METTQAKAAEVGEGSVQYRADLGCGNNRKGKKKCEKELHTGEKTPERMRLNRSFEGFEKEKTGQESGWLLGESKASRTETEKKCECSE